MLRFIRKLFGKKAKRKKVNDEAPDTGLNRDRNDVKIIVTNELYVPLEYNLGRDDGKKNFEGRSAERETIANENVKRIGGTAQHSDGGARTKRAKNATKWFHIPRGAFTETYDHLTGFMDDHRDQDGYDVLFRDRCYPELLKKYKSDLDIRESNNYFTISTTRTKGDTSKSAITSTENKPKVKMRDDRGAAMRLDPPDRNLVTKSLTMCGPRNVTRRGQYIRTRAGRPLLPLETMRTEHVTEKYIRAATNANSRVSRTESQVSRSNVDALRAQFDEKPSSIRIATLPRKQMSKVPLSLPVKSSRNSSEGKSELAESYLFNVMKYRVDSKGRNWQ